MFSIGTGVCSANCCDAQDSKTTERVQKAIIADGVLAVIFAIISILGYSGTMPLAVGITFSVLTIAQVALASVMKKCAEDMS